MRSAKTARQLLHGCRAVSLNQKMNPNPHIQLAARMRDAAEYDQTNAVPASMTKRILALVLAVPAIKVGYWLASPGLLITRAGHALFVACVERPTNFKKN